MRKRGFTLIELLVVIAIIGVLAGLLLPALMGAKKAAKKTDCKNNLKSIGLYFMLYSNKYGEYPTPSSSTWFGLLWSNSIATDGNLFRCAIRGKKGTGTHYQGLMTTGTAWTPPTGPGYTVPATGLNNAAPGEFPLAADETVNHNNEDMCILFYQGRVDMVDPSSAYYTLIDTFLGPSTWAAPAATE
ncbi:MAG: type II secretion system GspH family protein [Planctomycetes bacterium]|nr:type II secretion system GspH family protein [Planctomycetota bacterium]